MRQLLLAIYQDGCAAAPMGGEGEDSHVENMHEHVHSRSIFINRGHKQLDINGQRQCVRSLSQMR